MTLKEVALKAGCSVATASKALKNSAEISEVAKKRILAVAKELGYLEKATTHKAVLGSIKTVIFNDERSSSFNLYKELLPLAKKAGVTLLYTSVGEDDATRLFNQLGAFGIIFRGRVKNTLERSLVIDDDISAVYDFLKEVSNYRPERPSRAADPTKPKAEPKPRAEKSEPYKKREEEIWLL